MKPRASVVAALLALTVALPARAQTPSSYEQLQAFSAVLNFVRLNYVDSVTYGQMVRAGIDGVLRSLDPHSRFLPVADYRRRTALDRGELAVTGLVMEVVDGRATVLAVLDKSPARRAGLQPGDRLLTIDDSTVQGLDEERIALRLAGEKGQRVRLRMARGSILEPDSFQVSLKRDNVPSLAVSVATMADSITGLVRLSEFNATAAREVERAIRDLKGRRMRRLILDLRGNPGGYVGQAVDIASLFLPKGAVVFRTEGRRRAVDTQYVSPADGPFRDLPLILLIDGGSASASEALAGSLQDHDRALVIGRRSFGKALMQMPFILQTGDVVMLTVGRVLTPGGRFIQRRYDGLTPEQYRSFRGQAGAAEDTTKEYHTDAGRPVRGGGGITPDLALPGPVSLPVWFSVASDSAWDTAVADSVAQTLPAAPAAGERWLTDSAAWQERLLTPFLARTRTGLQATAIPDSSQGARIARILAYRAAEVRWGPPMAQSFLLRNDADLRAALASFPRLPALLAPTSP